MTQTSSARPGIIHEQMSELGLCWEICQGQTSQPVRPVRDEKFLIGSGADCDLRLGGTDIPALHSLLHFDGDDLWLEAIATQPELKLNGRVIKTALLRHGDRLELGVFELMVRLDRSRQRIDVAHGTVGGQSVMPLGLGSPTQPDRLREMTAAQLVDALDHDMQLVERFDERRKMGAEALLQTARQHDWSEPGARNGAELDVMFHQLHSVLRQLEERSESLQRRERSYTEVAATLIEVQERMTAQLENIQRQVEVLRDARESVDHRQRASA